MSHSKALIPVMVFTYTVAAARQDAHALGKGEPLRQAVLPLLAQFRKDGDPKPIFGAIESVLGVGWEPTGEFKTAIEALIDV